MMAFDLNLMGNTLYNYRCCKLQCATFIVLKIVVDQVPMGKQMFGEKLPNSKAIKHEAETCYL